MSRIRGPYVRFCERAEANLISSPHPTRFCVDPPFFASLPEAVLIFGANQPQLGRKKKRWTATALFLCC